MIRYQSTSDLAEIFFSFRVCFSKRSWPYLGATAVSWLLRSGQRTVRSLGQRAWHKRSESGFYRFFSHFKVDLERLSEILLLQIVAAFGRPELLLVVDDTLCPKWGRKIYGTGVHYALCLIPLRPWCPRRGKPRIKQAKKVEGTQKIQKC